MPNPPQNLNEFSSLVQLMQDLRGPEGCPWDKEQTHQSLAPYAIEETFEMIEALESHDDQEFCEELGDVLFQVVIHAQLAQERGAFNINDVVKSISEKIIRRHPHVFSETKVNSTQDVIDNWAKIKASEKANKPKKPIFSAPKGLPALSTSQAIGVKTEKLKFDWNHSLEVLNQLKAEIIELEEELAKTSHDSEAIQHELGDVLFSATQLARHLNQDAETSLRVANTRFQKRFNHMLSACGNDEDVFKSLSRPEKENLWKKAKVVS